MHINQNICVILKKVAQFIIYCHLIFDQQNNIYQTTTKNIQFIKMDSTLYEHKQANIASPIRNGKSSRPSSAVTIKRTLRSQAGGIKSNFGSSTIGGLDEEGLFDYTNTNIYSSNKTLNGSGKARPATALIHQSKTNPMLQTTKNSNRNDEIINNFVSDRKGQDQPQIQKIIPKNINADKERLYEDTLHLKQSINFVRAENMKLKTKIIALEKENAKLIKTIGGLSSGLQGEPTKNNESFLLVALKKQVKEMKDVLASKDELIETLKRDSKVTYVQELEAQLQVYNEEMLKQKKIIDQIMNGQNMPLSVRDDDTNIMMSEVNRLQAELKFVQDQNQNYQIARELNIKQTQKIQTDCEKLKRHLKEKEKEIERLQHIQRLESALVRKSPTPNEIERKHNNTQGEEDELKKLIKHKDAQIAQQERTINDLMAKLQEKTSNEMREKQIHTMELNKQKELYAELESKYRALIQVQASNETIKGDKKGSYAYKFEEELPTELRDKSSFSEARFKKVRKVTYEDVKEIGYEINVRLRLKRIDYEELEQKIFADRNSKSTYSIAEMKEILAKEPFNLKDEEQLLLTARYLIESNEEDYVYLDTNRTSEIVMVRSVLKQLIGSYTILNKDTEANMIEEVGGIIHKYEESLKAHYTFLPGGKSKFLTSQQIKDGFKALDIAISPKQMEFLLMRLYEHTGDFKKIEYMKMFEIFENEEHKRIKKIIEEFQTEANQGYGGNHKQINLSL